MVITFMCKPTQDDSKTDPQLAKTKPISDSDSVSGVTNLRKGKLLCESRSSQEREE